MGVSIAEKSDPARLSRSNHERGVSDHRKKAAAGVCSCDRCVGETSVWFLGMALVDRKSESSVPEEAIPLGTTAGLLAGKLKIMRGHQPQDVFEILESGFTRHETSKNIASSVP